MRKAVHAGARRLLPVAAGAALVGLLTTGLPAGATATAAAAAASTDGPDYEMPFPCGDTWNGSSRYNHSPSALAIDWNKPNDLGAMMVSSAPGVVTSVVNLGNRSYGRYIIVDHGNGRTSLYAHLSAFWSVVGQSVDQGTPLGQVGSSGGSTGPHLHFEERTNRKDHRAYFHRSPFTMGTTLPSRNCGDAPVVGDWDGNGTSNIAVQRRGTTPSFYLKRPGHPTQVVPFGWRTDQPVSGDWNGNGVADLGVRRAGVRAFVLRAENGTEKQIALGSISDFGVTGDWNGDKRTDVGVWSPSSHVFTLRSANGSTRSVTLGTTGDRPVTGDWNGDKKADVGIYSQRTATFTLRTYYKGKITFATVPWGTTSSLPVTGDWNGDGLGDVGVWDPTTATYTLRVSPPAGSKAAAVTRIAKWGYRRG
jgi:hypothetical protein